MPLVKELGVIFFCAVKIYMGKFCNLGIKNKDKKFFVL